MDWAIQTKVNTGVKLMCSGRTWYACSSVILLTLTPVDIRRQVRNKVEGRYYVHDKTNISVVICDTNILQQLTNDDGDHKLSKCWLIFHVSVA